MTYTEIERLNAITKIHHEVGSCLEIAKIARILVRTLAGLLKCDACAFMLVDGKNVKILADMGFTLNFSKLELNTSLPMIQAIITDGKPIITNNLSESQYTGCMPKGCTMNSIICLPVVAYDQVKAILHLDSIKPNAFSDADIEFASLAAREASLAVERALIFGSVLDMAIKDGLTGCYNRRKMDLDIEAKVAEGRLNQSTFSYLMIDIDRFKHFNDTYGHARGDQCLKEIAGVISSCLRPGDAIYRYGGEEFVLLANIGEAPPDIVAERLRMAVESSDIAGTTAGNVTISIGVATYPDDGEKPAELAKAADARMYLAKQNGRNQVCSGNLNNK